MPQVSAKAERTRERLIEAAGEVFAEKGFRSATIRDIVKRAGANLNAVNYHFRDKEGLYLAVIEYAHHRAEGAGPPEHVTAAEGDPEQRLRTFVHALLRWAFSKDQKAYHAQIMAREIIEPTGVLDVVIDRFIRPRFEAMLAILRDLVGPDVPRQKIELCVESLIGQCIHFVHARPVISRIMPQFTYTPENVEMMADHVADFTLAAIRQLYGSKR